MARNGKGGKGPHLFWGEILLVDLHATVVVAETVVDLCQKVVIAPVSTFGGDLCAGVKGGLVLLSTIEGIRILKCEFGHQAVFF